jgi:ubiquitin carboxyl-terminal hydrolase 7
LKLYKTFFINLQFKKAPVDTIELVKCLNLNQFAQEDVQEFLRSILSKLKKECLMNETFANEISKLFEGKMISTLKYKSNSHQSETSESFNDLQLHIIGNQNIYESFDKYTSVEQIKDFGSQGAEKTATINALPPVLHLHLVRFQYDRITKNSIKINDRFEFYEQINLSKYLSKQNVESANYILHSILVHSGNLQSGHYVAFINPNGDGNCLNLMMKLYLGVLKTKLFQVILVMVLVIQMLTCLSILKKTVIF